MPCLLHGKLLLRPEAAPHGLDGACAAALCQLDAAILAAGIDDDNLVAEGQAVETGGQLRRPLMGNQDG